MATTLVQSLKLELPPSCIEFCPAHPSYFLVGTYHLEEEMNQTAEIETRDASRLVDQRPSSQADEDRSCVAEGASRPSSQSRTGSIILFQLRDEKAHLIQSSPQASAVFDLHFTPLANQGDICAAVSSTGTISLFRLVPKYGSSVETSTAAGFLQHLNTFNVPVREPERLFTSFAWHPVIPGLMAITTGAGTVMFIRAHECSREIQTFREPILEHQAEAWCVAFSPYSDRPARPDLPVLSAVFSGGDDGQFKFTTYGTHDELASGVPADGSSPTPVTKPWPSSKAIGHGAGVTAILAPPLRLPDGRSIVLTGSYDEHLRVYSVGPLHHHHRAQGLPDAQLLASRNLGGGVWRLKALDEVRSRPGDGQWQIHVLASCMHAGPKVLRIAGKETDDWCIEVCASFDGQHNSMNYGSDYMRRSADGQRTLFVSTSFYDKLLCVWTWEGEGEPVSDKMGKKNDWEEKPR